MGLKQQLVISQIYGKTGSNPVGYEGKMNKVRSSFHTATLNLCRQEAEPI